ncbi:MAG: cysteine desulfurase [Lachnospiraceae bacterium]|nr:cysteine desulfurase [Lachnospiraceae bacterium]
MQAYLDNSATTAVRPEIAQGMADIMTSNYGNPSSAHHMGVEAEKILTEAKKKISATLSCDEGEILFTSGGTESDNLAIIGTAMSYRREARTVITTQVEHPAVMESVRYLSDQGFEVKYLPVNKDGSISPETVGDAVNEDTLLVSVMHVNNEIGAVNDIHAIGDIIKKKNPKTFFHVDDVQGYGKFRTNVRHDNIDLLSVSSHKIHGPKGVGFLYHRNGVRMRNLIFGGGQQGNMRSGTENVPGIYGAGAAAEAAYRNLDEDVERMYALKTRLEDRLLENKDVFLNEPRGHKGAPHIVSASIEGVRAEVFLHALEDKGIYVSSGSACSSNRPHISTVLTAIGLRKDLLDSTIRFSLSSMTTEEEIDYTADCAAEIMPVLRKYRRS